MRLLNIILLAVAVSLSGCVVTGGVAYTDPKTGATATLGINKEIKPKMRDSKSVVKLRE